VKSPRSPLAASEVTAPRCAEVPAAVADAAFTGGGARTRPRQRRGWLAIARDARPELVVLILLAGILNLWALSSNGWANDYYAAAVRSMSGSWHDFLFGSLDPSGVMTVDKPPLALWIQSLSVRIFGYHSLSLLVPQALEGIGSVVLLYDLLRRHLGRVAGCVGGLALALTPITVAMSRHNNPDALLVLCCMAALWFAGRALQDHRTRWIALAGAAVGLGFETKMLVALVVVPGIVAAWLWIAPRGRLHALRQLLAGGGAMLLLGGAWPLLVELTPAADRPWISGTSDNRVLSLIFEYNGLGRVDGQAGGPGAMGGGNVFGGNPGPLRLLNSALGGQAGWLLGLALLCGAGMLISSRLRRSDPRTGLLMILGGSLLVTAILFSAASGIFHPYYVSLLAPFVAALVGAGAGQLTSGALNPRIYGPLGIAAATTTELLVLRDYPGQLSWLAPVLIAVGAIAALALIGLRQRVVRLSALAGALAALLIAPSIWAADTLGYPTSSTFPAGGPQDLAMGGAGGPGRGRGHLGSGRGGFPGAGLQLFGNASGGAPSQPPEAQAGGPPSVQAAAPVVVPGGSGGFQGRAGGPGSGGAPPGGFGGGGMFGSDASLTKILSYTKTHGGGTIAVSSQSSAAQAIISSNADVAGIGGFSGRESDVSVAWLAHEVSSGQIRWVLDEEGSGGSGGFQAPAETRPGAKAAMAAAARACQLVNTGSATTAGTLYDCQGRAAALSRAG
jgi:4-amino-4-deoxy-L-arabinose transferase-like glycosyltransferase